MTINDSLDVLRGDGPEITYEVITNCICQRCNGTKRFPHPNIPCDACAGTGRQFVPLAAVLRILYREGKWPSLQGLAEEA